MEREGASTYLDTGGIEELVVFLLLLFVGCDEIAVVSLPSGDSRRALGCCRFRFVDQRHPPSEIEGSATTLNLFNATTYQ